MSNSFNMTSEQIVNAALRKLSVLGDGLAPSPTQLENGTQALNVMLKSFEVKGITDVISDDFTFPPHWLEAVIYGLAYRLSPEFGIPLQDRQMLGSEAKKFLDDALEYSDTEDSLFFQPDRCP